VITIRRRTALVLAVTATQLLCLGAALVGYAQWLRRDLTTAVTNQVLRDNRADLAAAGSFGDTGHVGDETYVIGGTALPDLGITVLAHQRQSGIDHTVAGLMATSVRMGLFIAIGLVGVTAASTAFVVGRYENTLVRLNANLETLVDRRTRALTRTQEAVIFGLAKLADSRDEDTGQHLQRIQAYVRLLCDQIAGHDADDVRARITVVTRAAALHDVGKVGVPDNVLWKPGPLSDDERTVMQQHTVIGGNTLRAVGAQLGEDDFLKTAREIAESHHEWWDGTGYPHGLCGRDISLPARIVALADVYDALTTPRVYKRAWSHEDAMRLIVNESGRHFDPAVVEAFCRSADAFRRVCIDGPGE